MARTYDVKLTRTTVEECSLTVEAPNQVNAAARAAMKADHAPDGAWTVTGVSVDVTQAQWKQGGE